MLRLVKTEPPAQPPTPQLTPARKVLGEHFARIKNLQDEITSLNEVILRSRAADEACAAARAAFESVGTIESMAWREFVSGGTAEAPAPQTELRLQRASALNIALAISDNARGEAEETAPKIVALEARVADLINATKAFVSDVLIEDAKSIGLQYTKAVMYANALEAAIRGISTALQRLPNCGQASMDVEDLLLGARRGAALVLLRQNMAKRCVAVQSEFAALGGMLAADPAATIEIE